MKFRSFGRAALALAVPGLATLLASCGGGHTIDYAYVQSSPSTSTSNNYIYDIRSNDGSFAPAHSTELPTTYTAAVSSVTTPDHRNLYVLYGVPTNPQTGLPQPNSNPGIIVHYGIRVENGDITPLDTVETGGTDPVSISLDSTGAYLLAVDTYGLSSGSGLSGPGDITIYSVQPSSGSFAGGALSLPSCGANSGVPNIQGTGCTYPVGYGPRSVTVTPGTNNFVYVANSGNTATLSSQFCYGTISGFTLASGGGLTPITFGASGSSSNCAGPSPVPTGSLTVGAAPWAITSVAGSGSTPYVYVADFSANQVYAFSADSAGALTFIAGGSSPSGTQPENILAVNGSGYSNIYVSNFKDNSISVYNVALATGVLTPLNGSPYTVGTGPLCMAVEPNESRFLYVTNYISGSVSGFSITGSSGALAALVNQPYIIGNSSTGTNPSQPTCLSIASNGT